MLNILSVFATLGLCLLCPPSPLYALPATVPTVAASARTSAVTAQDSIARVRVRVTRDSTGSIAVSSATVRSGVQVVRTDTDGTAVLQLSPVSHVIRAGFPGLRPDSVVLMLRAGSDTSVAVVLSRQALALDGVVVSASRSERRLEDTPLRIEVIDDEEIAEKVAMSPGDIAMMLNETSGLRVQTTNPSLGGANVRIQGLRGRYSLILADGLPLYGGQAGGLGLLQIPPVDLGRVEIIKGSASALYGSSALGGVINLVSHRPGDETERTVLLNQTSRGGTDAVYFGGGPMSSEWGYTLLAGAHVQQQNDLDGDRFTDMAGFQRALVRPRVYFDNGRGRSAFVTAGYTGEGRSGGTLRGGTVPSGGAFDESLGTRRADVGGLARWLVDRRGPFDGAVATVRGSAMQQSNAHGFGAIGEDDRHRTWFSEAALAIPRVYYNRSVTYVLGVAFQQESYRSTSLPTFNYSFTIPAAFVQLDADPASWMSLSASLRADAHSEFGAFVNPRLSLLMRGSGSGALSEWSTRWSVGTGAFAPTPFTEETEVTGLTPLRLPAGGLGALSAERATSASVDVGGPLTTVFGRLEVNGTLFGSRVANPLQVREVIGGSVPGTIALGNAVAPTRTWGAELLARLVYALGGAADGNHANSGGNNGGNSSHGNATGEHGDEREDEEHDEPPMLRITGSYTYLQSRECLATALDVNAPSTCLRGDVPLTPRHAAGIVASVEQHGRSRVGIEVYYTGRQALADNPFRTESRPYVIVGLLGERAFNTAMGVARLFVNFENLTNVRQTRFDPLLLPSRGPGGRWTTDAWTDLSGFTANGGVRLAF